MPSKSLAQLCTRPEEGDSFTKLNINGESGRGRKLVNGIRPKLTGAQVRKDYHGKIAGKRDG